MTVRAGELRPSQAVTQFGPGSLVDLPTLSMVIAGTDEWNLNNSRRIDEPRLARRLHVDGFREPPFFRYRDGTGGIPARIFPRFLVCPRCNRLAPHGAFDFNEKRREHKCKAPACKGLGNAVAYPVRFMVACPRGHLADFPWHAYLHPPEIQCSAELKLEDSGQTGSITDLWVKCPVHGLTKNLGQAFGAAGRKRLPRCAGERPWLGDKDPETCGEELRVLLRGASNAYFPVVESAISIPPWSDPIQVALGAYFEQLAKIDSLEKLKTWLELTNAPELNDFAPERLWDAIERRRSGEEELPDLRGEEWRAFQTKAVKIDPKSEFQSRVVATPVEIESFVSKVVLLERLREVRALRGFTRIDPVPDVGDMGEVEAVKAGMAPIKSPGEWAPGKRWLPGIDFRGEGILLQLREDLLKKWESLQPVEQMQKRHERAQVAWHQARDLDFKVARPARYLLLHTLAHLLIRQLALDCGYSSASLRERIYSSIDPHEPMAGILVYTATADSEGSLGGLVEMGRPDFLGPMLERALQEAQLCANDPLCADREPNSTGTQLNGAACHACLLISETACEAGNHYLDRGVLVRTLRDIGTAFIAE